MITDGHHQDFDKSRPEALEQRNQVEIIGDILATPMICNNWESNWKEPSLANDPDPFGSKITSIMLFSTKL
jgi:hypothetical protein